MKIQNDGIQEKQKSETSEEVLYCTYLAYPRTVLDFTRVFMSTKTFKTASREGYPYSTGIIFETQKESSIPVLKLPIQRQIQNQEHKNN